MGIVSLVVGGLVIIHTPTSFHIHPLNVKVVSIEYFCPGNFESCDNCLHHGILINCSRTSVPLLGNEVIKNFNHFVGDSRGSAVDNFLGSNWRHSPGLDGFGFW